MKTFINEYAKILAGLVITLIIGLSFYNIINNVFHYNELKTTIIVTDSDKNFIEYKKNVEKIKENIDKYDYNNHAYIESKDNLDTFKIRLSNSYKVLISEDGLYNLKINDEINVVDINNLNEYLLNTVYNDSWIKAIKPFFVGDRELGSFFVDHYNNYSDMVNYLINDTNYVKKELKDNSNFYYSSYSSKMNNRFPLREEYNKICNIYNSYSKIILEMSYYLVNGEIGDTND